MKDVVGIILAETLAYRLDAVLIAQFSASLGASNQDRGKIFFQSDLKIQLVHNEIKKKTSSVHAENVSIDVYLEEIKSH